VVRREQPHPLQVVQLEYQQLGGITPYQRWVEWVALVLLQSHLTFQLVIRNKRKFCGTAVVVVVDI
jgi:hypothetical protein